MQTLALFTKKNLTYFFSTLSADATLALGEMTDDIELKIFQRIVNFWTRFLLLHNFHTKKYQTYFFFLLTVGEIDDDIELPTSPVSPEELQAAIIQETTMAVAVKSEIVPTTTKSIVVKSQQKSIEELSSLGVGTFSIDKDTAKNMASGRFVKRIKIKRCGKCKVNFLFRMLNFLFLPILPSFTLPLFLKISMYVQ